MQIAEVERLKDLEEENRRLKKMYAELEYVLDRTK